MTNYREILKKYMAEEARGYANAEASVGYLKGRSREELLRIASSLLQELTPYTLGMQRFVRELAGKQEVAA